MSDLTSQPGGRQLAVDEPECEPVTDPGTSEMRGDVDEAELQERLDTVLGADEGDDFSEGDDGGDGEGTRGGGRRFATPGGGFAGSEAPILRAMRIARRNGLTVTSTKRTFGSTGSDHHVSQSRSCAADRSNGSAPTLTNVASSVGSPGAGGAGGGPSGLGANTHAP